MRTEPDTIKQACNDFSQLLSSVLEDVTNHCDQNNNSIKMIKSLGGGHP